MNVIKPDLSFIEDLKKNGGDDLKKCFQCATCTSVCTLSEGDNPFPRKEMAHIQWGLKDRVVKDRNLWLCHQCGDCTTHCPRGAKPADVLASARRVSIMHYAFPKKFAEFFSDKKYLKFLVGVPAIILFIYLLFVGHIPEGEVHYGGFFPHLWLNTFYTALIMLTTIFVLKGVCSFWSDINKDKKASLDKDKMIKAGVETLKEIFTHSKFEKCGSNKARYLGHLGIFYGFIALLFVTAIVVVLAVMGKYPLGLWNPLKILGNISAIALFAGCTIVLNNRLKSDDDELKSTYFDWYFFWTLYVVTISGVLTEFFRYTDIAIFAYPVYFIHLVAIFNLLIYLPFSKFAHIVYRTVAIFHDKLLSVKVAESSE